MRDTISIKPKILSLHSSNDIYMTLNICILSNDVNYNNAQFLDDFIDGVIENKEFYTGIPFVVNREKLENAEYDQLNHELKEGKLLTDQIGSFINFWKEEIDDANCLMGEIRVFKRFPLTCQAIADLYEKGQLETSCEVLIQGYAEISDDGVRKVHFNEGKNVLIGSAIVTNPAESRAKPTLLVAEAYEEDKKNEQKGELSLSEQKYNKSYEIKYHGQFETASLKFDEVANQIYNLLNPIDAKNGGRTYNYYIRDLYTDYLIVEDWNSYEVLYKIPYTIANDLVALAPKDEWQKGSLGFIPEGVEYDTLVANKEKEISELESEITKKKEELETMSKENEKSTEELSAKITELETKVNELSDLLVSEKEEKSTLEGTITELQSKVEELTPYKENFEKAEKEKKVAELSAKYSKLLSEDTFKSERVQTALEEMNNVELNSVVVEEIAKEKITMESASANLDSDVVTVIASKQDELIVKDKHEYWASPRA